MNPRSPERRLRALAVLLAPALLAGAAIGQEQDLDPNGGAPPPVPPKQKSEWRITPFVEYQFGGDEIDSLLSGGVAARWSTEIHRDVSLSLRGSYRYDDYDFDSTPQLGEDIWDSVHTLALVARFDWRTSDDWTVFAGPIFLQSNEDSLDIDIDFDENSLFGAFAGVTYQFGDGLLLGGGLAVVDEYQDNARWTPIVVLNWEITSDLRLTTLRTASEGQPGVELEFDIDRDKQIALGIGYRRSRFRLDDDNRVAPDGVGEVSGVPLWGRFTIHLTPNATVSFRVGAIFNGNIELEFDDGRSVDTDRDTAGFIAVGGRFTF